MHPPPSSLTPTEQVLWDAGAAPAGQAPLQRRTNSAPLGQRFSAAISLSSSLLGFRTHHTLSDSDSSSDSSSSSMSEGDGNGGLSDDWSPAREQQAGEACSCCACGSGLRCRDPQQCSSAAAAAAATAGAPDGSAAGAGAAGDGDVGGTLLVCAYISDDDAGSGSSGSRRSSSNSAARCCACCGACSVLAEVQSLPLDGLLRKQQSLVSIPSITEAQQATTAAAVEAGQQGASDSAALPLLGHHHQHHEQQLSRQGSLQQQLLLQHDTCSPQQQRAASLDPVTGGRRLGVSVGLMVGGIAEMFMIRRDHERIKLRDRKGFVRIALEHGTDILPVYMFGVNQALDFGPPWLQRLSRKVSS